MSEQGVNRAKYFEEFEENERIVSGARTVTETDIVMFAGLSGDYYPLHTDEEFAKKTQFGTRIAHGALIMSISTGLIFNTGLFSGTAIAYFGLKNWFFKQPILIGDTIHVIQTVKDKRLSSKGDRGTVTFFTQIINQKGDVTQEGEQIVLIKTKLFSK